MLVERNKLFQVSVERSGSIGLPLDSVKYQEGCDVKLTVFLTETGANRHFGILCRRGVRVGGVPWLLDGSVEEGWESGRLHSFIG